MDEKLKAKIEQQTHGGGCFGWAVFLVIMIMLTVLFPPLWFIWSAIFTITVFFIFIDIIIYAIKFLWNGIVHDRWE